MGYWSKPEMDRDQMVLISTTLSERIPEDHSVRLFWELLETYDWRPWEGQYCGCQGQPAIPPRIVAGVLLYGLTQGIRSSRRLEWACGHAVDFMWLADPQAPILPNKDGGFRPNYTPVVATDSKHRYLLAETVQADEGEGPALLPLLEDIRGIYSQAPETGSADSAYSTPENLEHLAGYPTDMYIAPSGERLEGQRATPGPSANAARRDDPRQAVPEACWKELARTKRGRLAQEAFLYDASSDCYWCPMGQRLALRRVDQERRDGRIQQRRVYLCASCGGCRLREGCAGRKRYRRIRARSVELWREKMRAKVYSEQGRAVYRQRQYVAESPFGLIKTAMGVRQFLLRGWKRVQSEWRWICTAYDLRIRVRWVARQRQRLAAAGL
ncbi:MAG TPA: transposase [Phycisphaerae bacterium]|nr:transposase [Phycisphaerae bacterium]